MADTTYTLSEDLAREVQQLSRLRAKVDGLSGDGVTNSPWGILIRWPGRRVESERASVLPPAVLVKIVSAASGGGKYVGRIVTGSASGVSQTGNLALPESLTVPTADDVLIVNAAEDGAACHMLATGGYYNGTLLDGATADSLSVVAISSLNAKVPANPLDLTYTGNHATGSTETYDGAIDVAALRTQSTYDGVKVTKMFGVCLDTTNGILYGFKRDETYNLAGGLVSATATSRVVIDTLTNCTASGS